MSPPYVNEIHLWARWPEIIWDFRELSKHHNKKIKKSRHTLCFQLPKGRMMWKSLRLEIILKLDPKKESYILLRPRLSPSLFSFTFLIIQDVDLQLRLCFLKRHGQWAPSMSNTRKQAARRNRPNSITSPLLTFLQRVRNHPKENLIDQFMTRDSDLISDTPQ